MGKTGHMTLILCSAPGDDPRIAVIEYFRDEDGNAITAAEYFEYENYRIAHPIDERSDLFLLDEDAAPDLKRDLLERGESSKSYWQCVTNRFVAGCSGCVTACWITEAPARPNAVPDFVRRGMILVSSFIAMFRRTRAMPIRISN